MSQHAITFLCFCFLRPLHGGVVVVRLNTGMLIVSPSNLFFVQLPHLQGVVEHHHQESQHRSGWRECDLHPAAPRMGGHRHDQPLGPHQHGAVRGRNDLGAGKRERSAGHVARLRRQGHPLVNMPPRSDKLPRTVPHIGVSIHSFFFGAHRPTQKWVSMRHGAWVTTQAL